MRLQLFFLEIISHFEIEIASRFGETARVLSKSVNIVLIPYSAHTVRANDFNYLTATDLGIPAVSGVLYLPCRQYFTGQITYNALVSLFNECTAGKIPHITKSSDLQHFFAPAVSVFSLLMPMPLMPLYPQSPRYIAHISARSVSHIAILHRLGTSSSFVYRFTDRAFLQIEKPLFNMSERSVERLLEYSLPDFTKGDAYTLKLLKERVSRFGIVSFDFREGCHLSKEQIELGQQSSARCRIPVCYESISLPAANASLFQFPVTTESQEFRLKRSVITCPSD
jgi:hypothetical protein